MDKLTEESIRMSLEINTATTKTMIFDRHPQDNENTDIMVRFEMAEAIDLRRLRTRRGQLRGIATRFQSFMSNMQDVLEVKTRLEKVESAFVEFDQVQSELELLDEEETEVREEIENVFYKAISTGKNACVDANINSQILHTPQNPDTFNSLIDNNVSLDAIQKFHYLKSCLREDAAQIISSLEITEEIPQIKFDISHIKIPDNIQLADPKFNIPNNIDILIGASIFYDLIMGESISLGTKQPTLRKTKLGWILSGIIHNKQVNKQICNLSLNKQLTRFWEIEEVPFKKHFSLEEQYCESYFKETTTRNEDGRFIVKLPHNDSVNKLGDSKAIALKRLNQIELKFEKDQTYKTLYNEFLKEYLDMEHMTLVNTDSDNIDHCFYLPHHAVRKEDSSTTKLRVVFDGSAITNTGISLNNCLHVGPTIQDDLFDIVIRFRTYPIVFTGDIAKMYRMVLVHPEHRNLQRILWRENDNEPVQSYTLNTLTYGTAPASFLAIRCLHELAYQNQHRYPEACNKILKDFYVDDLLTGTNTVKDALKLKNEIYEILKSGGFELRKWSSNSRAFVEDINSNSTHLFSDKTDFKLLGLIWDSKTDILRYSVNVNYNKTNITKRQILSLISQIYDPLGLIGPATIKAKIIMQNLWQCEINWDDPIPSDIAEIWQDFSKQLNSLNDISVPRHVLCNSSNYVELHGFCDASESAYGCCIYLRSLTNFGECTVRLLCAKSKVAPLKRITLPKLELCGALLLAKLTKRVLRSLTVNIEKTFLFTDSSIVLSWISTEPCYLKTFVANRIAEITELTSKDKWYHVKSELNPADIISRGTNPNILKDKKLWWCGPNFLNDNAKPFSSRTPDYRDSNVPEMKRTVALVSNTAEISNIFTKFSSLTKLKRVIAYVLRFKNNALCKDNKISGPLRVNELNKAMTILIKIVQFQEFADDIKNLTSKIKLSNSSKLLNLNPFLDEDGIIRVGGRLKHSHLSYNQKHPTILPTKHTFTELLILHTHLRYLHMGTQALLATIRLEYWPLSGKVAVKRILRKCIKCFRAKPKSVTQIMGDLPSDRFSTLRPFYKCGVDYAGPLYIKNSTSRKAKNVKAYICLFICLSTKAVHIELVRDLSTDAFINSLKRFISRRGKPSDIYSDNGTNFRGAARELQQLYSFLSDKSVNEEILNFLGQDKISWHFIPSNSPHMGGIWEAAIKSAKYHIKRILSQAYLTFEDMYTLLVEVEACLNSRPLTQISNDPLDFSLLTPSHFLIGDSLLAIPETNIIEANVSRLNHYQRLKQIHQHFWQRWSREYLSTLQTRSKWKTSQQNNLNIGRLVILKEESSPPLQWTRGRIVDIHPGSDGLVRVVSVKVPNGRIVKRSIAKVCLMPVD
ncbi:uncharacterized protein LOC115890927 [Sitophilus oryzae]|uniref:Uncharacterized protein LOC115890927 n=1 Tax=Sitophilus oryzae TaxID=7048 RepID=A0A6J2YWA9_SITOR|nr:uncharacterized protein LOC115890927 [Sitophilus oryzae]